MRKLLTISIAAYNVESYIRETLDSIIKSKYIDDIEVFVIDDDSPDDTLSVVNKEYADKYPLSIFAVHKSNGGYGTTVNYAVDNASGLFFKILDGDDLFDTNGLDRLIEFIKKEPDVDWILTETLRFKESVTDGMPSSKWSEYAGRTYLAQEIDSDLPASMWESCFKTSILKEHLKKLPEHTLYTDILYMAYTIPFVNRIGFIASTVYCYRRGRDGQSVTIESRLKHYKEQLKLCDMVMEYYYEIDAYKLPKVLRQRLYTYL